MLPQAGKTLTKQLPPPIKRHRPDPERIQIAQSEGAWNGLPPTHPFEHKARPQPLKPAPNCAGQEACVGTGGLY